MARHNAHRCTVGALLLIGIAGGVWLLARTRVIASTEALAAIRLRNTQLSARMATMTREIEATRSETAKLREVPATAASSGSQPARASRGVELPVLFAEHPEWQPIYHASEKANAQLQYAPFIFGAGLSPAQRDAFADEMALHEERQVEANQAARQDGWPPNDPRVIARRKEEETRHIKVLTDVLGDGAFAQLVAFERTSEMRSLVGDLAQGLYSTNTPLDAATAERLTIALARHATNPQGNAILSSIDWPAAAAEARALLSPEQFDRLQSLYAAADLQRQLNRIVTQARR